MFAWNVNNGRYDKVINGEPSWDNSNWIENPKNKIVQTKIINEAVKDLEDAF